MSCMVVWRVYDCFSSNFGRTPAVFHCGKADVCGSGRRVGLSFLAAIRADPQQNPAIEKRSGFPSVSHRQARTRLRLGGDAARRRSSASGRLPGIAHALVFWAFCAFALVTLNHCAGGFRRWLSRSRQVAFGRLYFYFAAAFALACAVGILGLFVRRFLVRPKWLGESFPGSRA